jgi:hypothetical protein
MNRPSTVQLSEQLSEVWAQKARLEERILDLDRAIGSIQPEVLARVEELSKRIANGDASRDVLSDLRRWVLLLQSPRREPELTINIERDGDDLLFATSPQIKGLLVAKHSVDAVLRAVPDAILALERAVEPAQEKTAIQREDRRFGLHTQTPELVAQETPIHQAGDCCNRRDEPSA